jgi:hypothetical protein
MKVGKYWDCGGISFGGKNDPLRFICDYFHPWKIPESKDEGLVQNGKNG